jgi:hypothetical protein
MTASETMRGKALLPIPIADPKCLLQDALDLWSEEALSMIADQRAASAQQMRETGLMNRLLEASIWRPPLTHQDPVEPRAKDARGFTAKERCLPRPAADWKPLG